MSFSTDQLTLNGGILTAIDNNLYLNNLLVSPGATGANLDNKINALSGQPRSYIDFTTNILKPSYLEGRVFYDSGLKTLSYYPETGGVTQNIGQESWIRAINVTTSTILNGKAVYVSGSMSGLPAIALARADLDATSHAIGVTTMDIFHNNIGYVTRFGIVHEINVSGINNGTKVYLSQDAAGGITGVEPMSPNFSVPIGVVTVSGQSGNLLVIPSTQLPGDGYYATSGGLTSTGQLLNNRINLLSGNLVTTGITLLNNTLVNKLVPIQFSTASGMWINMPLADGFFMNSIGYTQFIDLTNYTGVQLCINKTITAGVGSSAATSMLQLKYLGHFNTTVTNYLPLDSSNTRSRINFQNTYINSGWKPIVAGARSGVFVTLMGSGGDGAVDPSFGMITAYFM